MVFDIGLCTPAIECHSKFFFKIFIYAHIIMQRVGGGGSYVISNSSMKHKVKKENIQNVSKA